MLDACNTARRQGADFPTIWWQINEPNPIVAGLPVQQISPFSTFLFGPESGFVSAGTVLSCYEQNVATAGFSRLAGKKDAPETTGPWGAKMQHREGTS